MESTVDTLSDELFKSTKKEKLGKLERRRILEDWAFILPQLVIFIFLTIVPFFVAVPILFTDMAQFNDPKINPVGLRNFTALFTDPSVQRDYLPALRRTIVFVVLNYATVYIFGLSLALLMYEVGFRGGFFTIVYLPLMVSGLAVGYMAAHLLSSSPMGQHARLVPTNAKATRAEALTTYERQYRAIQATVVSGFSASLTALAR